MDVGEDEVGAERDESVGKRISMNELMRLVREDRRSHASRSRI